MYPRTQNTRLDSLQRLRDYYEYGVSNKYTELVENYRGILASAHISESIPENTRENFQIDVYTTNIIKASESLLKMIAELKHSMTLNDFKTIRDEVTDKSKSYSDMTRLSNTTISQLKSEMVEALYELEDSYYSSKYRNMPAEVESIIEIDLDCNVDSN
eukprot:TRINITY_DN11590_c0_g1_i1.p1 TRINITY_DN11590_c0_g1~~TRINITY_DN11590_c0_g1_i1.p1  ORF type:complete len:159 (-),score=3.27 TRINITY_DN11590_c0_g1_i1:14-490(-)